MITGKFYCNDSKRLYHVVYNLINQLSEECDLDVCSSERDEVVTNIVYTKDNKITLFESDNPLKLVDFLLGYQSALKYKKLN